MELNQNFEYQDQDQQLPEAITFEKCHRILKKNKIIVLTLSDDRKSIGLFHCSTLIDCGSSIFPSGSSKRMWHLKISIQYSL